MRFLLIAIALLAALPLSAQTVSLRSGEHPTFSRLVFEFGTLPDWSLGRTDTGFALITDREEAVDLSRVFDRMPPTRLLAIRAENGAPRVELQIGCDCHVEAFEHRGANLVLDIHDGPAPPQNAFDAPLPEKVALVLAKNAPNPAPSAPPEGEATATFRRPAQSDPVTRSAPPHRPILPGQEAPAVSEHWAVEAYRDALLRGAAGAQGPSAPLQTRSLTPMTLQQIDTRKNTQAGVTTHALQTLSRAVGQGLVDPGAVGPQATDLSALASHGGNLDISTAIDRANSGFVPTVSALRGGLCLSGSRIDVAGWGSHDTPHTALAEARSALIGEFDVVDQDAVRRLGRLYIQMGFGAEARAVLQAFPSGDEETALLLTLAALVDLDAPAEPALLANQIECDTEAALWAALAAPFTAADIARSRQVILATFSALPAHLRHHLGPTLVERLVEAGDTDAASSVLGAIRRDGRAGDARTAMAVAALAKASGREEPGPPPESVAGDTALLAETVLRRLADGNASGALPGDADMALLPILAFELRGSDTARALREAEIDGYRRRGEIPSALGALSHAHATGAIDRDTAERHFRAIALAAAGSMNDASLVVFAKTAHERLGTGPVSAEARYALADRLVALGFAGTAEIMVADLPDQSLESRLRRARIDLLRNAPEDALAELEGLNGAIADDLRARAFTALARNGDAAESWAAAGAPEAARTAWQRAGDWPALENEADAFSVAATTIRTTTDVALDSLGPGAVLDGTFRDAADRAIEISAARREAIANLLNAAGAP